MDSQNGDRNGHPPVPEVSIIINCFNEAGVVRETLDSVFAQTFEDWEIIFWDNASSDGSREIAASYGERVRVFSNDVTVPLGRARKLAYEKTRGNYIAILDADDIWLPNKLERQLELFHADEDVGMTYCDAIYYDHGRERNRLFKITRPHRGRVFGDLLAKNFIFSSTMMFRRSALDKLDCAFDDRFFRVQDLELSLRVAYNYAIDYVDEPLVKWRMSGLSDKPYKSSLVSREEEARATLVNLVDRYPEIATEYSAQLVSLNRQIDFSSAVNAWQDHDLGQARKYLAPHLRYKKFSFVYVCTFLMSFNFFYKIRIAYRDMFSGGRLSR